MRIRVIAMAAVLAVGLVGCVNTNVTAFDRPQVETDVIELAAALQLHPESTRLLWTSDDREIYAAQQNDNDSSMCVVVFATNDPEPLISGCTTGVRLGVAMGSGEEYILVRFELGDEADGWERLAEGLWRKL